MATRAARGWLAWGGAVLLLVASLWTAPVNATLLAHPWRTLLALACGLGLARARFAAPFWRLLGQGLPGAARGSFNGILFLAGSVGYAVLCWQLFAGQPVLDDDVSALMQARIFASGRLTLPLPPLPDFFWIPCWLGSMQGLDHMCTMYPPGHAALLLPGIWLGVPWLVNPLLGGGLAVLTAEVGRELFGRAVGRVAGLLALTSPFLAVLSATYLSHVPTAFFLMLALLGVCRLIRRGRWRYAWLAGCGMAMAFLCRPLTAMVTGLVLALAPLVAWRRSLRYWRPMLLTAGLVLGAVVVLLLFTQATTGDWRLPGHQLGMGRRGKFGFVELDWVRTHTVALGIRHSLDRMGEINAKLLGWPLPAFLMALLPVLLRRADRRDLWLWLLPLTLLGTYMAFWYYESEFPARYIFAGLPALIILAARGTLLAAQRLGVRPPCLLGPLVACNLAVFLPAHLASFRPNHWDLERILPRVVQQAGIRHAVVFMDSVDVLPLRDDPANDFYATGFMRNNLTFDGDVVFARNRKHDNWRLARQFPDRAYYLYRYNRRHNRAHLYRLTFEGRAHKLTPLSGDSRYLMDPGTKPGA